MQVCSLLRHENLTVLVVEYSSVQLLLFQIIYCTVPSIYGTQSSWCPVTSGAPQGSVLSLVLFYTSVNDLGEGTKCSFSQFPDDAKVDGSADLLEGKKKDLDRLDGWDEENCLMFNRIPTSGLAIK